MKLGRELEMAAVGAAGWRRLLGGLPTLRQPMVALDSEHGRDLPAGVRRRIP